MTDMPDDAMTVLAPTDAQDVVMVRFDYAALESETRIVVQQRTNEIRDRMRRAAQDIVEIGERLAEVRDRLDDRIFSNWLQAEFAWSRRTAYNCIAVYEQLGGRANFAQLSIAASALYLLAAPTTPEEARTEVLARAEAGEPISHTDTKNVVQKHRTQQQKSSPAADPADDRPDDLSDDLRAAGWVLQRDGTDWRGVNADQDLQTDTLPTPAEVTAQIRALIAADTPANQPRAARARNQGAAPAAASSPSAPSRPAPSAPADRDPAPAAASSPSPDQARMAMTVNLLAVAYQEVDERWREQFPDIDAWTAVPFDYEALLNGVQQMIGTTVQEMVTSFIG